MESEQEWPEMSCQELGARSAAMRSMLVSATSEGPKKGRNFHGGQARLMASSRWKAIQILAWRSGSRLRHYQG